LRNADCKVVIIAATNVHMQIEPKRIGIQFPALPADNDFISITNHRATVRERKASDLHDALVLNEPTHSIENPLDHRGIPESALHG